MILVTNLQIVEQESQSPTDFDVCWWKILIATNICKSSICLFFKPGNQVFKLALPLQIIGLLAQSGAQEAGFALTKASCEELWVGRNHQREIVAKGQSFSKCSCLFIAWPFVYIVTPYTLTTSRWGTLVLTHERLNQISFAIAIWTSGGNIWCWLVGCRLGCRFTAIFQIDTLCTQTRWERMDTN